MSYQYSNPFQQPPAPARSTFGAAGIMQGGNLVLFGGLPLDVSEQEIRDLLTNQPLSLPASTTSAKALYGSDNKFTGFAIITVSNETDAERIRREYSGQVIDGTFRLTVQHILPPTQPIPAASVTPMIIPSPAAPQPGLQNRQLAQKGKALVKTTPAPQTAKSPEKAPGLKLLSRISKPGPPGTKNAQLALLAKQKANLKGSGHSGAALLSRIAKTPAGKAVAQNQLRKASGNAKVARAKQSMTMDVDKPVSTGKPKGKTQADLDEEMRQYQRQSRFQ